MNGLPLARIEGVLANLERLATALRSDPDGDLRRSIQELHRTFAARGSIEPAVQRVLTSLDFVHSSTDDAPGVQGRGEDPLERLGATLQRDLLPDLRRLNFEV